jgi:DUF2946 family protein
MLIRSTSLRNHRWLISLAVLAFALRALIPAGFMPGGSGPLTLQICPDGFPIALLASQHTEHHHHHSPDAPPAHDHHSWTSGHCVFSAVAGAPPVSHPPFVTSIAETTPPRIDAATVTTPLESRFRIAQPRAPPRLV